MTSQVFYRKWRPQTFSEIAGQEHVVQTLRNAITTGRIAHAYLFCGPRGSGKTSTARILAKAINCQNPVDGEPCNQCDPCLAINKGNALDVIEIDEASNRGIDDMNDLKERVNYSPNILRYKVYIIDEVHMITREGANAFLKTLEEPPPHVIFILATTDPHKIISTITSRCQRHDFHRLSSSSAISRMKYICEKEGVTIDQEALKIIARVTTGSLRDATNLLEQLITHYGNKIELAQVQSMLGMTGDSRIRELAGLIMAKDISKGLKVINSIAGEGLDLRQFNREFVDYLRQLLLVKSGSTDMVDAAPDDIAEMQKLVAHMTLDYVLNAIKLFSSADLRMDSYSPLPLELALVESVLAQSLKEKTLPPEQYISRDWHPSKAPAPRGIKPLEQTKPSSLVTRSTRVADSPAAGASAPDNSDHTDSSLFEQPRLSEPLHMEDPGDLQYLRAHWKDFINYMRGEGSQGNLDARLRHACEPVEITGSNLVLGFYHDFHKAYIDNRKYLHLIEKKLNEVFGHTYTVTCVLIQQAPKPETKEPRRDHLVEAALNMGARIIEENSETEEK